MIHNNVLIFFSLVIMGYFWISQTGVQFQSVWVVYDFGPAPGC